MTDKNLENNNLKNVYGNDAETLECHLSGQSNKPAWGLSLVYINHNAESNYSTIQAR